MADVQKLHTVGQNSITTSTTVFDFTFEYFLESDVKVSIDNVDLTYTTQYTVDGTNITLTNAAPARSEDPASVIRVYRQTSVDQPKAQFFAGSAIRANDLNDNNTQVRYLAQETENAALSRFGKNNAAADINMDGNRITGLKDVYSEVGVNDDISSMFTDSDAASIGFVKHFFFDSGAETVLSDQTWQTNDTTIATTAAVVNKIDEDLAAALTTEVHAADGISITDNLPNPGNITIGISQGSVDLDRIKPEDIVDTSEANADNIIVNAGNASSFVDDDTKAPTVGAVAHWFENFVQANTPTHPVGSGYEFRKGQFHFAADNDNTLTIYNGSTWVPVVAGVKDFLKQTRLIWVDEANGSDNNDGHRVVDPMKTIKAAVASANHGDMILVQPGVYREICPIDLGSKKNVSIIGLSMRSVFVHPTPATQTAGMFKCGSGCFIANMTLSGVKASGTRTNLATGANSSEATTQGWYFQFSESAGPTEANGGASIDSPNERVRFTKSPYIQNVTAFADSNIYNYTRAEYLADNSVGGYFDPHKTNLDPQDRGFGGDLTSGITGGALLVDGSVPHPDSPLRSFLTDAYTLICLDGPGVLVKNEGYAQLVSTFGHFTHYHAKAESGGMINMSNCTTDFGRFGLIADGKSNSSIFSASALVAKQGSGKTVHLSAGDTGWRGQTNPAPADHMVAEYTDDTGVTTIHNVDNVVKLVPGDPNHTGTSSQNEYQVTFANDPGEIDVTDTFTFYLRSTITTGGHVFEFAGSGTDYRAHPDNGGTPVEGNQVQSLNDGKVYISSSDHNGKFKVGDVFSVSSDSDSVNVSGTVTTSGNVTVGGTLDAQSLTINGSAVNTSGTYFDSSGDIKDTAMPDKVTSGTSNYPSSVTVDAQGRVTAISAGTEPVTSVTNATDSAVSVTNSKTPVVDVATFAGSSQKGIVVNDGTEGNDSKYLKGDGTWADVTSSVGLSAAADGTDANLVLERSAGNDTVKFAAGTGINLTVSGASGSEQILIEAPTRVNAQVHISDTVPTSGVAHGDLYFDFATGESYLYYDESLAIVSSTSQAAGSDAQWVQFAPQQRGTGNGTVTSIQVTGGTGLSVNNANAVVTSGSYQVSLDDTAVTAAQYGSSSAVPQFSVDQQGRITAASDVNIGSLDASAINAGSFHVDRIPSINGSKIQYTLSGTETDAWDVTNQEFIAAVIPDIDPSTVKYDLSGTATSIWDATNNKFTTTVIPNLTTSKIPYVANNHAAFNAKQIPDLSSAVTYYTDPNDPSNTQVTVHGYLKDVVQDTTPELGGNLQVTKEFTVSGTTTYTNYEIQSKNNENIILNANGTGVVSFANSNGTKYVNGNEGVTIKPPTLPENGSYTLTLPTDDGTAGQYLKTDGSGNLGWADDADTTYSLAGADDSNDFRIRLSDGSNNDDVKLKAGTGVSLDNSTANECTINVSAVPTGAIMYWPGSSNIPTGWKECNGEILLIDDYSDLNTALGTNTYKWQYDLTQEVDYTGSDTYTVPGGGAFNTALHFQLPDLRGEFIRGWNNGRGVDTTGRGLGSAQDHQLEYHNHEYREVGNQAGPLTSGTQFQAGNNGTPGKLTGNGNDSSRPTAADGAQGTFGTETRPRNIAMIAIIKT